MGWATSPAGARVEDLSQDGGEPDPDEDGDSSDDNDATVIELLPASIGIPALGFPGALLFVLVLSTAALVIVHRRSS